MGKTYRQDARNDGWRKAKQQKFNKKQVKPKTDDLYDKNFGVLVEPESPFNEPPEYHESFA